MRRWRISLAVLLTAIWVSAPSYGQEKHYNEMGLGVQTCAQFGKRYGQNASSTELIYFSWAQGFMTATNIWIAAVHQPTTNLALWDLNHEEQVVRSYCADHPLEPYEYAVVHLFTELRRAQGLGSWR